MLIFDDTHYMRIALREAYKGLGRTSPNPPVGAVLVDPQSGEIISKGYHKGYGLPHAERVAIDKAKAHAKGAYLYVTLEPCAHHGKTPPCTSAIISAGIRKVICGIRDPNPRAHRGLDILKEVGIEVAVGVLSKEVKYLTRFFLSRILRGRPWVMIKVAQSIDGRIGVSSGDSKWISEEKARVFAHKLRSMCDAIVVGRITVERDDPELTTRLVKGKNPFRIILDSKATLSPKHRVFSVDDDKKTILVCGDNTPQERILPFVKRGVEVWRIPLKGDRLDLNAFLEVCQRANINSLLVEGGGILHGAFLEEGLVDELFVVVAPILIGDPLGVFSFIAKPLKTLSQAHELSQVTYKKLGRNLLIHGFTKEGKALLDTPLEYL
ncbi:MAG: bifunctional diaminohydroxyphosphoribosylaminopyrimidine deaminase/5-amino-6-(5-phosphoribosylamino)uracil reductase RibD [Caldimicrobium sp.]|nr:bifunctional diaminohydroxyphosphoribosylaminopyrimidine deaminase/5-amino-6-(5-phosphoribosylamino)uracil reductase RibD [Caldimicrobium sp.]MCX7873789.1 bifunctional diaminohydroxyphosphoribosylaminopyrimidine deaminase/5-amino-6-(5-phosphoribosylamino)uracil reductase RibD [Caldimicrobium sp.]MDW8094782.1 bifunctional diaminohydroxyphosphoribosylaminopyrimidine deaminase/5-amino-6-(5-phosphoribosylamino)uracil reductase RibD [Caldimicrobium sp.]